MRERERTLYPEREHRSTIHLIRAGVTPHHDDSNQESRWVVSPMKVRVAQPQSEKGASFYDTPHSSRSCATPLLMTAAKNLVGLFH